MSYIHTSQYDVGESPFLPSGTPVANRIQVLGKIPRGRGEGMPWIASGHIASLIEAYVDVTFDDYDMSAGGSHKGSELINGKTRNYVAEEFVASVTKVGFGIVESSIAPTSDQRREWGFSDVPAAIGVLRTGPVFLKRFSPEIEGMKKKVAHDGEIVIYRLAKGGRHGMGGCVIETDGAADFLTLALPRGASMPDLSGVRSVDDLLQTMKRAGYESFLKRTSTPTVQGLHELDKELVRKYARAVMQDVIEDHTSDVKAHKTTQIIVTSKYTVEHADAVFKTIIGQVFENEFADKFKKLGLPTLEFALEDSLGKRVAAGELNKGRVVILGTCVVGDWMSDVIAGTEYGMGVMTSVIRGEPTEKHPLGLYIGEVTAGVSPASTATYLNSETRHLCRFNPGAIIYNYAGLLQHVGKIQGNNDLGTFGNVLWDAYKDSVSMGGLPFDLAKRNLQREPQDGEWVNYREFMAQWGKTVESLSVQRLPRLKRCLGVKTLLDKNCD